MHITIVTAAIASGGAQRVIVQLLNKWIKDGDKCSLILLNKEEDFYKIDQRVSIYRIGKVSDNNVIDKLKRYKQVRDIVKKLKPDVVLSMPEEIGIYVIGALLGIKVPVVVSERNNPWVMPYKKVTRILRKILYPFASGLIFQTKGASSFFSKRIQEKGIILPNPLDISRLPEPYHGERRKIIVGVGRLEKQKNFSLLIEAFADFYKKNNDYELHIFGDGSLKQELSELSDKLLPKGKVKLLGNNRELLNSIKDCAIFALSSDYEGVPNVLIEAMAIGMPVISTDCDPGGARELIENGVNGIIVPKKDISGMHSAMEYLIQNPDVAAELANNAIRIKERLNADIVCREWKDYLICVSGKNK